MSEVMADLEGSFESFHARFDGLFGRREPRRECRAYVRGLLSRVPRRNCWQMAEVTGEPLPDALQRLLYRTQWDAEAARDLLVEYVAEQFGAPQAVAVVDETGFLKCGRRSVGVQRQYTGTAGKITNCQIGVFLGYASPRGHVLVDRRLYLPEEWCQDDARRQRAQVPAAVAFRTKPQLALEMLEQAWARGLPMGWVVADEVYGNADYFRAGVAAAGHRYVVTVSTGTPLWAQRPPVEPAQYARTGRRRRQERVGRDAPAAVTAGLMVSGWRPQQWTRRTVAEGEQGPITYDWARRRVVESRAGLPGDDVWLLARRSLKDPTEVAYYLSNAPRHTPLSTLAQVATNRWSIEQCFKEAKGQAGLDEYEVRLWHSWYRHMTLVMMAYAWLAAVRREAH